MSRYAAAAGIRRTGASADARKDPFIVIVGPSGQCTSVPAPSGLSGSTQGADPAAFNAYHHAMSHVALAWIRNEIVTSLRTDQGTIRRDWGYAWQPYGQQGGQKKNDAGYSFESLVSMSSDLMFDGFNWKTILYGADTVKHSWAYKRIVGGAAFWTAMASFAREEPANYGGYTGKDPVRTGDTGGASAPSGWRPLSGLLGKAPFDVISSAHFDEAAGNIVHPEGILADPINIASVSTAVNDVLQDSRGNIYVAVQHGVIVLRYGGKGQWLWSEGLFSDADTGDYTRSAGYQSRLQQGLTGGSVPRSLAEHDGEVYMLSNTGKVHILRPDSVRQVANLKLLGTPWSSGIFGGTHAREPQPIDGAYTGSNVRRPLLVSFNGQLHAFLNFRSGFRLAKATTESALTTGRGVFWATSFDGRHWTDQSPNLPSSGIVSPSGGDVTAGSISTHSSRWIAYTSPYRFSGFTGPGSKPMPTPSGDFPPGYGATPIGGHNLSSGLFPAQPSGLIQRHLPFWSSGNMIDPIGTPFDSLRVPLEHNTVSGYLFPTLVRYPKGFRFQDPVNGGPLPSVSGGVFRPSGVGPSGYDYTGCSNYHVAGYVDHAKNRLQLYFSRDFTSGGTLMFELGEQSGWVRRNYLPHSKQLNGYVPVMLYDPEIIIPSGTILYPNPSIDEVNKTVTVKYRLYDWPFWRAVDVISEYSTDYGASWNRIGRQNGLSTGSKVTDPSGVNGTEYVLSWDWTSEPHPLSKNEWQPHVQIRLRAIDPTFDPTGGV